MQQPLGFESSDRSLVCKLNKALYDLKQAPLDNGLKDFKTLLFSLAF